MGIQFVERLSPRRDRHEVVSGKTRLERTTSDRARQLPHADEVVELLRSSERADRFVTSLGETAELAHIT